MKNPQQISSVVLKECLIFVVMDVPRFSSSILAPSACRSASSVSKGVFPHLSSVRGQKEKRNVL